MKMAQYVHASSLKEWGNIGKMKSNVIKCPVCGKSDVEEYDICPFCNWKNYPIQLADPMSSGGANKMSLEEARKAYSSGQKVK